MINNFEIGTIRTEWKNNLDGYKVDYSDLHGFSLYAFLQSPSNEELERMAMNADLVIYFDDLDGVGFFTFNFSGTGGSAAFSPSLLLDYPSFSIPEPLDSFPMTINVIDSSKGELKIIRSVALSDEFSKWFSEWCRINNTLNLSVDEVKEISKKYFDSLKDAENKRDFKIAYSTSKKCLNHERDSVGR